MRRQNFADHIKELEQEVMKMGDMVLIAISRSVEALKKRDVAEAKKIIADDRLINKMRGDIEEKCVTLIATQQPVATDLREIIAVMFIITDLERMGDYAEGIAKIAQMHDQEELLRPLKYVPRMAEKAASMLKRSLQAFLNRDAKAAAAICDEDDEVDTVYDQLYHEMLTTMIQDPKAITRATWLIWAGHNVERIADRVTNICERTVYLVTGSMQQINVSNY
jgi:phosphate transport system protein